MTAAESKWPMRRLKFVATLNDEALPEDTDPDFELRYIDIGNVDSAGRVHEIADYRFDAAPSRARRRVRDGDVIISTVRTYLEAIAPISEPSDNLIVSTGFAVVRPKRDLLHPGFCKYALRERRFMHEVIARSTGISYPAINASDLADIELPIPSLQTQVHVAKHLDLKISQIDYLIVEKEGLLERLTEKRRALITHVVTCGLNPDVARRDSGIPWVGEIPVHWEVWRVGHFAAVGNGSTPFRDNGDYWRDGWIPWLNSAATNAVVVTEASQFVTGRAVAECHLPMVPPGSVLVAITGQGKTRGQAALLAIEATINQHVAYVSPQLDVIESEFLHAWFVGNYEFLRSISDDTGGTKGALTCEQIAGLRLAVPPKEEQKRISRYLGSELPKIDALVQSARSTIVLLQERRSALISAAVTGHLSIEAVA